MTDAPGRPNDGVQEGHNMPSSNVYQPDVLQMFMGDRVGQKSYGLGDALDDIRQAGTHVALGDKAIIAKPVAAEPDHNSIIDEHGMMTIASPWRPQDLPPSMRDVNTDAKNEAFENVMTAAYAKAA